MDKKREDPLGLIGWMGSLLFHAAVLAFGVIFLIQPARFTVKPGETTMNIELIAEPLPPVMAPFAPRIPPTPQLIIPPAPPPTPLVPQIIPVPRQETLSPPIPAFTPPSPKPQPSRPVQSKATRQKTSPGTSNALQGAVRARPDDLHNEPPVYPEESQAAGEEGVVILRVEVTESGEPVSVSILKSAGYFRLDQAARRAVEKWKFHPAMMAGIPVHSEVDTPVRFKLQ